MGGQALAFWALHYDVRPVGALSRSVTSDVDFIGTAADAKRLGAALKWKVWTASLDDATAQTAKLTSIDAEGGVRQIDYLSNIVGLDADRVRARAVQVSLPSGVTIAVLHPLDVLESRLRNLEALPAKRDVVGVAQARLAIEVAGRFIADLLDSRAETRVVLNAVERVARIALDPALARFSVDLGLDPLTAVPASRIENRKFQAERWPRIVRRVADLRLKVSRRKAGRAPARKPRPV